MSCQPAFLYLGSRANPPRIISARYPYRTSRFGTLLLAILLASMSSGVRGQGTTSVTELILTDRPSHAVAGDIDQDGDQDLVVLSRDTNTLTILLGDGLGGWSVALSPPSALGGLVGHEALAIGDLDGVNGPDLVAINRLDGVGTIFLNNGAGVFVTSSFDLNALAGGALAPAGATAVAIVEGSPGEIWVALAGSFFPGNAVRITDPLGTPAAAIMASGGSFNDVTVGDFDSDGLPDVAMVNPSTGASGGVHLFLNDGLGGFLASVPFSLAGIGSALLTISAGDLDADGFSDDIAVGYVSSTAPFSGLGGTAVVQNVLAGTNTVLRTSIAGRSAVIGRFSGSPDGRDVMEAQSTGGVRSHIDYDSGTFDFAFDLDAPLGTLTGPAFTRLLAADLLAPTGPCGARRGALAEWAAISQPPSRIYVADFSNWVIVHEATAAAAGDAGVLLTTTGLPVIGDATFSIGVDGALPFASALLVIQDQSSGFAAITPLAGATGTVIDFGQPFLTVPMFLDASGAAFLPVPIPAVPSLVCLGFAAQWAVYDGLGVNSGITISQGFQFAIGYL